MHVGGNEELYTPCLKNDMIKMPEVFAIQREDVQMRMR